MFYLNYLPAENSFYYSKEKKDFNVVCYKNLEMVERFSMEDYSVMLNLLSDKEPIKRIRQFKKWREEYPYEYGLGFLPKEEIRRTDFAEMRDNDAFYSYYHKVIDAFADDLFPVRTYFHQREDGKYEFLRAEGDWIKNRKEIYLLYDEKTNDFQFSIRKEKQMRVVCKYPTVRAGQVLGCSDYYMILHILKTEEEKEKTIKELMEWRKRNPHLSAWYWTKGFEPNQEEITNSAEWTMITDKLWAVIAPGDKE